MSSGVLRYDKMVEDALKGVLRQALRECENGLPGDHHFYITFRTGHEGVQIPDYLRARYPVEMTIVIQFQFWGLEVDHDKFAITLSFNRVNERLVVPFAAVTAFADPSAKFGLQFQPPAGEGGAAGGEAGERAPTPLPEAPASNEVGVAAGTEAVAEPEKGQVIAFDKFRKK